MRRPGFGCVILVLLLALLPAASAPAATAEVSVKEGEAVYAGSDGLDDLIVNVLEPPAWLFKLGGLPGAAEIVTGSECTDVSPVDPGESASCSITTKAKLELGDGDDRFIGGDDGHALTIEAGAGDDQLTICCAAENVINGEAGNDKVELGGADAQNTVDGGTGDDLFLHPEGPDLINGGDGLDTVDYQTPEADPVTVTLDDQRNDGPKANQNVHADVENVTGGPESDKFVGSDAANVLKGGRGSDELKGGAGQDTLDGGEDDDTIFARDGEHDIVECGFGEDSATVDAIDTVSRCERVSYPDLDFDGSASNIDCNDHDASIHPGAVDVPGDGVDQDCSGADSPLLHTSAPLPPPSGSLAGGKKAQIRKGAGAASFHCRAPAGDTCSVKGSLLQKGKGKKIGSISGRVAGGRTGPLKVRLNGTGQGLLEDSGTLSATIKGTITNEAGAGSPLKATIQLRSPPSAKRS